MSANWVITALLLIASAVLQACAGMGGGIDDTGVRAMLSEMVDKPAQWLQSPEGQAYFQALVAKYAPGTDPTLLGGGIATGVAGLLAGLRALVRGESSEKASRKRAELWAAVKESGGGK